jgi:hypothetical protein
MASYRLPNSVCMLQYNSFHMVKSEKQAEINVTMLLNPRKLLPAFQVQT